MEIGRLAVIACTYVCFTYWCHDHKINPHDRRLHYVNRPRDLAGLTSLRYTVVDWPTVGPDCVISALDAELHARGEHITNDELASFIASLTASAAA